MILFAFAAGSGLAEHEAPLDATGQIISGTGAAWIAYHEEYLEDEYLSDDEEKKLLAALISISTGVDDPNVLSVPEDGCTKLLACYDALGEE